MYDLIGSLIAIVLIGFLFAPIVLAVYMWNGAKFDNDNDGKDDLPNRWQRRVGLTKSSWPAILWGVIHRLTGVIHNPWNCEIYHKTYAGNGLGNVSAIRYNCYYPTTKGYK